MKDYYKILDVEPEATSEVVKDFNNDDLLACATFRRIEGS